MIEKNINSFELKEMLDQSSGNALIVDVRELDEYELVRFKDSKLIPMNQIIQRVDEIDWDKSVVFVCRTGSRSAYIAQHIKQKVINLERGIYEFYKKYPKDLIIGDENLINIYFK